MAKNTEKPAETATDDSEFIDLSSDAPMYKPETCGTLPLVGWLLSSRDMPETENGPWRAMAIRTTRPTLAHPSFSDINAPPVEIPADTEVMVAAVARLEQAFATVASNPQIIAQVYIRPIKKVKLAGGRTMWTFETKISPKVRPRTGVERLLSGALIPEGRLLTDGE